MIDKAPASVTMSLDPKAIEEMLRQTITIQIANVLSGKGETFIAEMVKQTIEQKVDSNGNPSRDGYGAQPFITFIANKAIREGVQGAIEEWRKDNAEKIKAAFLKRLKANPTPILESLVNGTVDKFVKESWYGIRIEVGCRN